MKKYEYYRKQAEELVDKMTVEEQASQLTYNSAPIKRLEIPAYNWWNEALHGVARAGTATSFPQAIAMAAMFDDELLEKIADVIATEGRAKYNENSKHGDRDIFKGLTFWSPNINIFRDPRWGRGHETYGEDPYLTATLGKAFVRGLQGDGEYMKTAACAKHFAVHSGPESLRHEFDAVVSEKDLWETYLPAFEALVTEADVESVMGAYNRTDGEPCNGSYKLLRDILRNKWGFKGHVVSDCWAIKDFHMGHNVTKTATESVALAIDAGCDLNCGNMYLYLLKALEEGLVTKEQIREAAVRVYTTRFKLGLFEKTEYDEIPYEAVECKKHVELSVEAARRGIVLLKNDGILPVNKKKIKTVGVIGPNANSRLALKGNYYGTASRYITFLEGIQAEAGEEVRVLYSEGCQLVKDRTEFLAYPHDREAEALTVAEHSDIVVLFLGLDETVEGEEGDESNAYASGDKPNLELPEVQVRLLELMVSTGKPVVLCIAAGSCMNLGYAGEHCAAILQLWYPGAYGGRALADILFGNCSPSGKLPVTFYSSTKELPEFTDYSMKGRTYRYMDYKPLYPFGFGLTYGDIECTSIKADQESETGKDYQLTVSVVNRGTTACEDVIQLYLKNTDSALAVPNASLCGFKRVSLDPSEEKEVAFTIAWRDFLTVDEQGERIADGSRYELYAGTSQPDERSKELISHLPLKQSIVIK